MIELSHGQLRRCNLIFFFFYFGIIDDTRYHAGIHDNDLKTKDKERRNHIDEFTKESEF